VSPARKNIPSHLHKYIVEQNYGRYTPEDQAVWRFIMRQLKNFLSLHAHGSYVEGLKKTGISIEKIPDITEMDQRLSEFGWGAVPVSGFIPPAAFMEFQSLGILPIASDMRTMDHLAYTPAPDIVHEAAGHAPMLVNPEFARYLKSYGEVARNAILTREDLDQYEAIRALSDIKEAPDSTAADIAKAEQSLMQVNSRIGEISEAGWLSRMNWWTAEYGLIGPIDKPAIFGAGLLSSVGESRFCLDRKVKKVPLSVDCINIGYDITEPQPQLFVAKDFSILFEVLEQLAGRMAFRLGGIESVERALRARTVNTIELDSGLQISGQIENFRQENQAVTYLKMIGPVALALNNHELENQSCTRHAQGFSSPLGRLNGLDMPLTLASDTDLARLGVKPGATVQVKFNTGFELKGRLEKFIRNNGNLVLIQFSEAQVEVDGQTLYEREWGPFDLAIGERVTKVFGGPADRQKYGKTEEFVASRVPRRKFTNTQQKLNIHFAEIRGLREKNGVDTLTEWKKIAQIHLQEFTRDWLPGVELLEIAHAKNWQAEPEVDQLQRHLKGLKDLTPSTKTCVDDGLRLTQIAL
jgi:phenylalanine-4-hydroxylase